MEAVKFIAVYPTDVLSVRAEVINKKVLNDEQGTLFVYQHLMINIKYTKQN